MTGSMTVRRRARSASCSICSLPISSERAPDFALLRSQERSSDASIGALRVRLITCHAFFSARAFDGFHLLSRGHAVNVMDGETWLFDNELSPSFVSNDSGTIVRMQISSTSARTLESVFDRFSNKDDDYRFSRTHVPVALVRVGTENLVSRSQAKRLLARLHRFDDVFLDFRRVESIGQAFSDEIFRVFAGEHPGVKLHAIHTTPAVDRLIRRALAHGAEDGGPPRAGVS
jgi:hypothetical protein